MNFDGPIQGQNVIAGIRNESGSTTNIYFAGTRSPVLTASNANTITGAKNPNDSILSTEPTPTYYLPISRNGRFIGRRDELQELRQKLLLDKECQKIVLVGLGGIGKTQIALEFAQSIKKEVAEYSVFWMSAASLESFEQACTEIARLLRIAVGDKEDVKELVRQYLSDQTAGKWLLVVDNADDLQVLFGTESSKGVANFLPENDDGVIVFTSRRQEVAESLVGNDVIEVGKMSEDEAVTFLNNSLRKELVDIRATKRLVTELDCLPLAIAHAAAYININKIAIWRYLELLQNTDADLIAVMSREFRDSTRKRAVATTWVLSFIQIQAEDAVAADLLAFMSCIEWKGIPLSILPTVKPEELMAHAIGTICSYSFITKREDKDIYDMHRLVHLAMRVWLDRSGRGVEARKKAVQHVTEVFPSDEYENRDVWRDYLPHISRLSTVEQETVAEEKYMLLYKVGKCLHADGRIKEAVALLEQVVAYNKQVLTEDHPDRLVSEHALASAYGANGRVKEAVTLLEHVVSIYKQVLMEDHPDRLASQHELAVIYKANGQVKEGVALLQHVVTMHKQVLMEDHPSRLASQHALATLFLANGQVEEAVALLEHVVTVKEMVLMEDHPSRLASQHALAMAYRVNGQVKEAVALLEQIVVFDKQVLTEDHPDRLASEHALAIVYEEYRQMEEAVALV
jgi:tetratricopeptide (TPR) repeat protein